jgi:hypothetical protein
MNKSTTTKKSLARKDDFAIVMPSQFTLHWIRCAFYGEA